MLALSGKSPGEGVSYDRKRRLRMPRANANQLEFSFADLTRILTPRDGDYVTLDSSGRLQVRSSRGSSNRQNRQLVNRMLQLFMERMDSRDAEDALTVPQKEALKHYFLYLMEMPENGNCAAISMKRLRQAMDFVNVASSELVRTQRDAAVSPAEKRIAEEVAKRLPAAYLQSENRAVGGFSQYQDRETEKLREMLQQGQGYGVSAEGIGTKQLRTVASGRLFAVQNEVYTALQSLYHGLCSLNHGQTIDVEQLLSNEELMASLFAYAIREEAAVSSAGREAEKLARRLYIQDRAFAMSGNKELLKSINRVYVPELMQNGSRGLRQEVNRRQNRKRAWRSKQQSVKYGTQYLERLSDELQRFRELEEQAVRQGLSHEQAAELQRCGSNIDSILSHPQHWADIVLVATNMSSTRFAPAVLRLGEIRTAKLRYRDLANALAAATEILPQPEKEEEIVPQRPEGDNWDDRPLEELPAMDMLPEELEEAAKELAFEQVTAEYGIPTLEGESQRPNAEEILDSFSGPARDVAAMLLLETDPSSLIGENDAATVQNLESLYGLLRAFDTGAANAGQLNIKDVDLVLSLGDSGNVSFRIGNQQIPTIYSPAFLLHRIDEDICGHIQKYGKDRAERILNEGLTRAQRGEANGLSRGMLCDILRQTTGIPVQELSNVSTDLLSTYAQRALQDARYENRKYLRRQLQQQQNRVAPEVNEQEALEALRQLENLARDGSDRLRDRVEYTPTVRERTDIKVRWTPEEAAVQRLMADMVSPLETWQNDLRQRKTRTEQLRYTLYHHADTVAMMIQHPDLVARFSQKLGRNFNIPAMAGLDLQGLFGNNPDMQKILMDCIPAELSIMVRGMFGNRADIRKAVETMDKTMDRLPVASQVKAYRAMVDELGDEAVGLKTRAEVLERYLLKYRAKFDLEKLNKKVEEGADYLYNSLQGRMDESIQALYNDYEPLSDDIKDLSLTDLMKDNFSGNAGQARYMRKVLGGYFKQADPNARREMLASAIRDVIPEQPGENGRELQDGSAMSGFFKGAGPLFQKTLQGLPTDGISLGLRLALDDVKSRLRSIDPAIVTAQMNQLVEDSKGTISKISVERSLGAASVGEAFLCRIYGPELEKEGREAVIKLLRPDVKNRMEREKAFFLQCAKETDAGMAKTIAGQLAVYEKELDLRLEAKNIQRGAVYNKGEGTVKSERLMTLVRPQANAIMLEKANGTTVGSYFKQVRERLDALRDDNSAEAVEELGKLHEQLKTRQKFLTTLAQKWVTEGIFESGFYQADLHKDNIMIDDHQATIIDYGNATQLTAKQRQRITKMVFSASLNTPKLFVENYGELMPKASKKVFEKNKGEFQKRLKIIFDKKGDPGTKIAVALCEAQKLGLELPSAVYNFSMGQIRLKNTIEEGNNLLRSLANEIKRERTEEFGPDDIFREIHKELNGKYDGDSLNVYMKHLGDPSSAVSKRVDEYLLSGKNERFNALLDTLIELDRKGNKQGTSGLEAAKEQVSKANTPDTDPEEISTALQGFRCGLVKALADYEVEQHKQKKADVDGIKDAVAGTKYEDFFDVMSTVVNENLKKMGKLMGWKASFGYGVILAANNISEKFKPKESPQAAENRMAEDLARLNRIDTQMGTIATALQMHAANGANVKNGLFDKFVNSEMPEFGILRCVSELDIGAGLKRRLMNELGVFSERDRVDKLHDENQGIDRLLKAYKLLQSIKKNMMDSDLGQKAIANNKDVDPTQHQNLVNDTMRDLLALQPKQINRFVDGFEVLTADGLQEENVISEDEANSLKQQHQKREDDRLRLQNAQKAAEEKGFVFLSKDELTEGTKKKVEKKGEKKTEKKTEEKDRKMDIPEGMLEEDSLSGLFGKKGEVDLAYEPEFYFNYDKFIEENPEKFEKINSNDPAVLKSLESYVTPGLNQHLRYRVAQLEVIQEAAEDGKARGPVGKPEMDANQQNIVLPGVRMAEKQNTGNGCWSVSLASQLAYRGVNLDQRTIRAHRPDARHFGAQSLKDANGDLPNAMPLYTDLIQKLLPNTSVNTVEITEVSKDEARLAMENSIRRALGKDNSPLSFLRGGHYRTIYGIQDGKVLMYDSLQSQPDKVAVPLDDLVEGCKTMRNGEEVYVYSLQWLQDLKLNAHDEPELPTIPRRAGVKYMGGSLASNAQEDAYTSRDFMGFATEEKVNSSAKIVMLLPKQLKTTAIDGFYPEALKEIHDHAELAGVSKEALDLLDQYPRERPTSLLGGESSMLDPMIKWADKVQQAYNSSDDASKPYLREALEEVKNSLIQQEKLKLKTEIPEKLGDEDGKICYESAKAEQFEEVLAKSLWISKYEQMPAESREWIERTKPGFLRSAKTLAPTEDELEAVKTSDQYAPLFRDMTGRSDVARAQIQPNQGYDPWTVKYSEQIPYVAEMQKLSGNLNQGARLTDSLDGMLTDFAEREKQRQKQKEALQQAKDNVYGQEMAAEPEERKSFGGRSRISSEELAKKLDGDKEKAPENKQKLTRRNSFTPSFATKNSRMQK